MFGKTSAFSGEFYHYYSKDPAFDTTEGSGFDHDEWLKTADDKYLPVRNGTNAVRFDMRRLGSREWLYLQDVARRDGADSSLWMAVALAVTGVEPYLDPGGQALETATQLEGKLRRLSDEDMDRISSVNEGDLLTELGLRVLKEKTPDPLS